MHPLLQQIQSDLIENASSEDAFEMEKYMKNIQPFYGIRSPLRVALLKNALKKYPIQSVNDYQIVVTALWNGEKREELYNALSICDHYKKFNTAESWKMYVSMIHSADWWDTLDLLAGKTVGLLLVKSPELMEKTADWKNSDHLWTRRAAILIHLKHKAATNTKILSETILHLAHENEFFIQKAIGWVLREYSKTNKTWVQQFIDEHSKQLSSLSLREGSKYL